jgi:hypothetical protein
MIIPVAVEDESAKEQFRLLVLMTLGANPSYHQRSV